jgi:hypothetical protein
MREIGEERMSFQSVDVISKLDVDSKILSAVCSGRVVREACSNE